VTIFGIFFTPVFYYVIRWLTAKRARGAKDTHAPPSAMQEAPAVAATSH
jgi:hypothetical protein